MALTLRVEPELISPVYNPLPISYSSTFSTQNGFRYKYKLTTSADTDPLTELVSVHIYPDIDKSYYGLLNASMVYKNYVSNTISNWKTVGDITKDSNLSYNYKWTVTEYIGDLSGATKTEADWHYIFRGVKQYGDYWDQTEYLPGANYQDCKFLSNWSGDRSYKLAEYATINVLAGDFGGDNDADWKRMRVNLFDTGGTESIWYIYEGITSGLTSTATPGVYVLPLGPASVQLAYKYNESNEGGYVGIFDSTSDYYTITLEYYDGEWFECSETIRVDIDQTCYKHDGVQFVWVGELSTMETFVFRMADVKAFKTNRDIYKKMLYDLDTTVPEYTYSMGNRGYDIVNLETSEEHTVLSDWLTDEQSESLSEMYLSPEVYIVRNSLLYPVIIDNTKIKELKVSTDRLYNHSCDYSMAYEKLSNI